MTADKKFVNLLEYKNNDIVNVTSNELKTCNNRLFGNKGKYFSTCIKKVFNDRIIYINFGKTKIDTTTTPQ